MRDLSAIRDERRKREKASEKSYLFSLRSNLKIFLAKKISKKRGGEFFFESVFGVKQTTQQSERNVIFKNKRTDLFSLFLPSFFSKLDFKNENIILLTVCASGHVR